MVRRAATGYGLFARAPLTKGVQVIEYIGVKIPTPLADTLTTKYLFDLENGFTIDGSTRENLARYVNHSCAPNCEAQIEGERIFFYALQDISPGQEITIDYGTEYFDEFIKPFGCKCAVCKTKTAPKRAASGSSGHWHRDEQEWCIGMNQEFIDDCADNFGWRVRTE